VIFDAHGTAVRWPWTDVEHHGGTSRPVVYVAADSHASYPVACTDDCDQALRGESLGEGRFDGRKRWDLNEDAVCEGGSRGHCLQALPSTRDGTAGTLWNAFPGWWGSANCTALAKVCAMVDGPASPSRQGRFRHPWRPVAPNGEMRTAFDDLKASAPQRHDR